MSDNSRKLFAAIQVARTVSVFVKLSVNDGCYVKIAKAEMLETIRLWNAPGRGEIVWRVLGSKVIVG